VVLLSCAKRSLLLAIERLGYVVLKVKDFEQRRRDAEADKRMLWDLTAERDRRLRADCEIEALQGELSLRRAESETLQGELSLRRAESETLQGELSLRRAESETLQGELSLRRAEIEPLQGELSLRRAEIETLQGELSLLLQEKGKLIREINTLDQRRHDVNAKYREAYDRLNEALDEIRCLKAKIEKMPQIDNQVLVKHQAKLATYDMENSFHAFYERVKACSMTSIERLYAMHQATQYLVKAGIPGDIVECGVRCGGSMMMAALVLLALGDTSRRLVLFDTLEGVPKPDGKKYVAIGGHSSYDERTRQPHGEGSTDSTYPSLEEVRRNMESTGYPMDKVTLVKGLVQETIGRNLPDAIALLRLDTNSYGSTIHELKYLYPRLRDHGVLIADDYDHLHGQRQAIDDYFTENQEIVLLNRVDYSGRLAVKPLRHDSINRIQAEARISRPGQTARPPAAKS
jgi:O-methyltransferase